LNLLVLNSKRWYWEKFRYGQMKQK